MDHNGTIDELLSQLLSLTMPNIQLIDITVTPTYTYFMWDIVATGYLAMPEQFTIETAKANVSMRPPNADRTDLDENRYTIRFATDVNVGYFYKYLPAQFRQ